MGKKFSTVRKKPNTHILLCLNNGRAGFDKRRSHALYGSFGSTVIAHSCPALALPCACCPPVAASGFPSRHNAVSKNQTPDQSKILVTMQQIFDSQLLDLSIDQGMRPQITCFMAGCCSFLGRRRSILELPLHLLILQVLTIVHHLSRDRIPHRPDPARAANKHIMPCTGPRHLLILTLTWKDSVEPLLAVANLTAG